MWVHIYRHIHGNIFCTSAEIELKCHRKWYFIFWAVLLIWGTFPFSLFQNLTFHLNKTLQSVSCSYSYPEKKSDFWQKSSVTSRLVVTFKQLKNRLQWQTILKEKYCPCFIQKDFSGDSPQGHDKYNQRDLFSGWLKHGMKAWENTIVKIFTF